MIGQRAACLLFPSRPLERLSRHASLGAFRINGKQLAERGSDDDAAGRHVGLLTSLDRERAARRRV